LELQREAPSGISSRSLDPGIAPLAWGAVVLLSSSMAATIVNPKNFAKYQMNFRRNSK
jgi:hypothetical protein